MRNREGAEEKSYSPVTSPHDPPGDRESDGGDEMSHYSSCGGESELDRYCSCSSAIGTPSSYSSSFHDSEFGSFKSFKLGGENTNLKKIGDRKILSGFRDGVNEFYADGRVNTVLNSNRRTDMFAVSGVDLMNNLDFDDNWGNEGVNEKERGEGSLRVEEQFGEGKEYYRNGKVAHEDVFDTDGVLSRYDHSDGDDSMFACGSDNEINVDSYYVKNYCFRGEEREQKNENQLAMNSAVAFGSDDWDDYVQESGEHTIVSMVKYGSKEEKHHSTQSVSSTNQIQDGSKLVEKKLSNSAFHSSNHVKLQSQDEDVKARIVSSNQIGDMDELEEFLVSSSTCNIFQMNNDAKENQLSISEESKIHVAESGSKHQDSSTSEFMNRNNVLLSKVKKEDTEVKLFDEKASSTLPPLANISTSFGIKKNDAFLLDEIEDHFVPVKSRDSELNSFYDEFVNDMEDVLLDTGEPSGSRFTHGSRMYQPQFAQASRDGGSSASTSGTDYTYNWIQQPLRVDRIEVVGSRQKEGDVSLSERLVGVKRYTVYRIKVSSEENSWEVERRYREFSILYHRLKKLFVDNGWILPSPWSFVDRESRKLFANASPDVIADRSALIQECLQSVIHPKYSSNSLNALVCFLLPSEGIPGSPASGKSIPQSPFSDRGVPIKSFSDLGNKISLVVQVHPSKSMKEMLDVQHYRCAGCHMNFDDGMTRVQEFVQSLGWGKPRLCEYSNQLFCSSCHKNDSAVLPAKVLHYWDFTRYPVSQLAKSYLDAIHDQPMLCVSAVNPFLFSKVPTLQHVANIRNRTRTMLPYVRCPFRESIHKGLGSRSYLLDSNDFFALRDLIDLSKGVFSALPVMVETVSRKIHDHITEQCLVCYDVGIPCSARQGCDNPLSLIFPFEEGGEVKKCKSCESVFHKNCFRKTISCPSCGASFKQEVVRLNVDGGEIGRSAAEPSTGLLANLFSKVLLLPQRSLIPRRGTEGQSRNSADKDIIMGMLPNTSL